MARERERTGRVGRFLLLVALIAAAILLFRLLGPGSRPAEEPRGPAPAPAPAPSPAPAPPPTAPASGAPVGGRVLGPDGAPAEGAVVEGFLDPASGDEPRTLRAGPVGPDGRFDLGSLPAERRRLLLRASRGALSVEAELGGAAGPLEIDLRLPDSFTIGGIAVSAEEGRPLPGLEVRFGARATRTDALGRFSLREVPASLLSAPLRDLEISGAGRRTLRRPLPADRGLDDLLVRLERE